jgi:anti-sigma regulatory factor (Ser/Thr protein kinase)/putative methionine-R-sulfoxide reductase with GAF domain
MNKILKNFLESLSVKNKILIGVTLVLLILAVGMESFIFRYIKESHQRRVKNFAVNIANSLNLNIRYDFAVMDIKNLDRFFLSLSQEKFMGISITNCILIDNNNIIVADLNPENSGEKISAPDFIQSFNAIKNPRAFLHEENDEGFVTAVTPVYSHINRIGSLILTISTGSFDKNYIYIILLTIGLTVALVFLLGYFLYSLLKDIVIKPVLSLASQAREISHGNVHKKIYLEKKDELGQLARVLEMMRNNIISDWDRLQEAYDIMKRRHAQMSKLNELARQVTGKYDLNSLLNFSLTEISHYLNVEGCSIILMQEDQNKKPFVAASVGEQKELSLTTIDIHKGFLGKVLETRKPYYSNDVWNDPLFAVFNKEMDKRFRSILVVPIITQEKLMGIISIDNKIEGDFSNDDVEFLKPFASQLGSVIDNARLVLSLEEKVKDLNEANIKISSSEEKYRMLVEGSNDIVFTVNEDLVLTNINQAMCKTLKISEVNLNKTNLRDLIYISPEDAGLTMELIQNKIDDFFKTKKPLHLNVNLISRLKAEPINLNLYLEFVKIEGKTEIFGKMTKVFADSLAPYFRGEKQNYEIGNYLITAEEMAYQLVRRLPVFLPRSEVNDIRLCLLEMIINAIEHGNLNMTFDDKTNLRDHTEYLKFIAKRQSDEKYKNRRVTIEYLLTSKKLAYRITDDGEGFDHKKIRKRKIDVFNEEMLAHGRGILITEKIFDKMLYNNKGNQILLIKHLNGKKDNQKERNT